MSSSQNTINYLLKASLLSMLLFFTVSISLAQQTLSESDLKFFTQKEKELKDMQNKLFKIKADSEMIDLNNKFIDLWESALVAELSFSFPFDSLKQVGRLTSPDGNFRIINWNLPKSDGTHLFFGFIQTFDKKSKKYELHKLNDKSAAIKNIETFIGTPDKWFGMLYYKIIPCDDYYALLAWDGNDKVTQRKYIDILVIKENGNIEFGKDVFKIPRKNPRRIVFEYSAELVMSLKYNEDKGMIIFDHLAPKDAMMEGQFQFYGPDFSYDAYDYSKGKWKFIPDVDIKNVKNKNDNIKHAENKKEKAVYSPN